MVLDNGTNAQLNTSNGGVLTQAIGHTIMGVGTIHAALSNLGTVEAQGGTLTVAGPVTQVSGSTLSGGTWIAEANSTLNISSTGALSTNGGTVILNGVGSNFPNINPLAVIQGSFIVEGGRHFTTAGTLSNSGTVAVGIGSTLTLANGISNSASIDLGGTLAQTAGTLDMGANATISGGTVEVNGGTLLAAGPAASITSNVVYASSSASTYQGVLAGADDSLVLDNPAALLILSGSSNSFDGGTTVSSGTLELSNPGEIPAGTSLTVGAAGDFTLDTPPTALLLAASPAETPAAIPEPPALALLTAGALLAAVAAYRQRAAKISRTTTTQAFSQSLLM